MISCDPKSSCLAFIFFTTRKLSNLYWFMDSIWWGLIINLTFLKICLWHQIVQFIMLCMSYKFIWNNFFLIPFWIPNLKWILFPSKTKRKMAIFILLDYVCLYILRNLSKEKSQICKTFMSYHMITKHAFLWQISRFYPNFNKFIVRSYLYLNVSFYFSLSKKYSITLNPFYQFELFFCQNAIAMN